MSGAYRLTAALGGAGYEVVVVRTIVGQVLQQSRRG